MSIQKAAPLASFKALNDQAGIFEAVVAAYNLDSVGDRIIPGAFKASLDRWQASRDPIPVIWSHRWDDPQAHVGIVLAAEERPEGLWVKAQLDVDRPFARQVYDLLKARRVKEFSFAYDVRDSQQLNGANELRELELIEVGPTLKGVNAQTELLAVKAPAEVTTTTTAEGTTVTVSPTIATDTTTIVPVWPAKAGARNSADDQARLQDLHDLAVTLGAACAEPASTDDPDDAKRTATPEEPPEAKGKEPGVRAPLAVLAELELFELSVR